MSTRVDPKKVEELSAEFKQLSRMIEKEETHLNQEIRRLISDTRYQYSELYVQQVLNEIETMLTDIRDNAINITADLNQKSIILQQAGRRYHDEEEAAKTLMSTEVKPAFEFGSFAAKVDSGKIGTVGTTDIKDELYEDPVVQRLLGQIESGTEEEKKKAEEQLNTIILARNTIARAQAAYEVYKAFSNEALMERAHKEAMKQREILKAYDVDMKYYGKDINIRHYYKGTPIEACSYDPFLKIMKDGKPVEMPKDNQYKYLLGLIMQGGPNGAWAQKQLKDIHALLSEIGRSQVAWHEYKAQGLKKEMVNAHAHAEKIREKLKKEYKLSSGVVDDEIDYKFLWLGTGPAGSYFKQNNSNNNATGNIAPNIVVKSNSSKYNDSNLGVLSKKYESNGDPGMISTGNGDSGGASYGAYQFASNFNIPLNFVEFLKNHNTKYHKRLLDAYKKDGNKYGANFDNEWKKIAREDNGGFLALQHEFTKQRYYDVTVKSLRDELKFDVEKHSFTLQNVIWSRAVQHGNPGVLNVIKRAFAGIDIKNATEEELIRAIYKESGKTTDNIGKGKKIMNTSDAKKHGISGKSMVYFGKNSADVQVGVWARLNINEVNAALKMLAEETASATVTNNTTTAINSINNKFPLFKQKNIASTYTGNNESDKKFLEKFARQACLVTAIAAIVNSKGIEISPGDFALKCDINRSNNLLNSLPKGVEYVTPHHSYSDAKVKELLAKGETPIIRFGPQGNTHFVVATKMDDKGNIYVMDPASGKEVLLTEAYKYNLKPNQIRVIKITGKI